MNKNHKELVSIWLTLTIVGLAAFVVHHFFKPLLWAAIIVIATYPGYQIWQRLFGTWKNLAAFLFTCLFALLLILPLSWLISILIKESQWLFNYTQQINRMGGAAPILLSKIPYFGQDLVSYWDKNISQPGNVKHLLSDVRFALAPMSYYLKQISLSLAHGGVQVAFTLLSLFFLYRDGIYLNQQINAVGQLLFNARWFRYANKLPSALRSTVNGTIVVGLGVGVLMGLCYAWVGFPAPTVMGIVTAFAAMIPFVVPIVFGIVALILLLSAKLLAAILVILWGTLVMFFADHWIKPILIGGAIQLHFLAVLFSILGGLETMGLIGLFIGPIIMVLFMTLWHEAQQAKWNEAQEEIQANQQSPAELRG